MNRKSYRILRLNQLKLPLDIRDNIRREKEGGFPMDKEEDKVLEEFEEEIEDELHLEIEDELHLEIPYVPTFFLRGKDFLLNLDKNIFLTIALLGILLFVILLPTESKSESLQQEDMLEQEPQQDESSSNIHDDMTYVQELESKLVEIISSMEGCGKTSVMITLESTYEEVLQQDSSSQTSQLSELDGEGGSRTTNEMSSDRATIFEENKEGEKSPYVVKMYTPQVAGVIVVAEGGGNASVCKNISDVIQALFGIEAHKIKVVKMK